MIIVNDFPPNYVAIRSAFDLEHYSPIFAYGSRIFNPHRVDIPGWLRAHEEVHGRRQGNDPAGWWEKYIADENFRLAEEVLAHLAEYHVLSQGQARPARRRIMQERIDRLRSPLYGYKPALSADRAKGLMKWALHQETEPAAATG